MQNRQPRQRRALDIPILKGNSRGTYRELAAHLRDECENDEVRVREVRGTVASDIDGAMQEWSVIALGTRCRKPLYSCSFNPDPSQPWSDEHYADLRERTESALGLQGQPRIVVRHVKYGRAHEHVVWSRIDTDRMKAVHLSHDRQKLRTVVREFAQDWGLALPENMTRDRGIERFKQRGKRKPGALSSPERIIAEYRRDVEARRHRMLKAQAARSAEIEQRERELLARQAEEVRVLADTGLLQKPFLRMLLEKLLKTLGLSELEAKHRRERKEIERLKAANARIDQKELKSLRLRENRPAEQIIRKGVFSRLVDHFRWSASGLEDSPVEAAVERSRGPELTP